MRIGDLIAHYISADKDGAGGEEGFRLYFIIQDRWSEESNCLREVSDKESARIGLDAWVLFARQQGG